MGRPKAKDLALPANDLAGMLEGAIFQRLLGISVNPMPLLAQ